MQAEEGEGGSCANLNTFTNIMLCSQASRKAVLSPHSHNCFAHVFPVAEHHNGTSSPSIYPPAARRGGTPRTTGGHWLRITRTVVCTLIHPGLWSPEAQEERQTWARAPCSAEAKEYG